MSGRPDTCRVVVRSDEALVAETVRIALAARGLGLVDPDDPSPQVRADAGLLITGLTSLRTVGEAQQVIAGSDLPWAVVATTPRGPGWAAVCAAGARLVVDSTVSLEQIAAALVGLGLGLDSPGADISAAIVGQWEHLAARLHDVPPRELARWCHRDPSEDPVDDDAVFEELRQIEAALQETDAGVG